MEELHSYTELHASNAKDSANWRVLAGDQCVASFQMSKDDIGTDLMILGRHYVVVRPASGRFGGALLLDGTDVAVGRLKSVTYNIEIDAGGTIYTLRRKSFTVFRDQHRMMHNGAEVYRYQKHRRGHCTITGNGRVELPIVVFGLWLTYCPNF